MTQPERRPLRLSLLAACGLLAITSCGTSLPIRSERGEQPITKLTGAMLVDPSTLPKVHDGEWAVGKIRPGGQPPQPNEYTPPQCAPLVGNVEHLQRVSIRNHPTKDSSRLRPINMWLYVVANPPEPKNLLPQCGSVIMTVHKDNPNYTPRTIRPIDVAGIPPWAVAADVEGDTYVWGSYRGVYFVADFEPEFTDVAVQALNDQAAKLADA